MGFKMKKILLMLSGGLDSMVLAERAYRDEDIDLVTLFFRYVHPAASHEYMAQAEWRRLKRLNGARVDHYEIDLPIIAAELAIGSGRAGPRVVPMRNLAMVAIASNLAAAIGASEVWFGANADDAADYDDCRAGFVNACNQLTAPYGIIVRAPLLIVTKPEIIAEARELGLSGWASCYQPIASRPCGSCNSCIANGQAHD